MLLLQFSTSHYCRKARLALGYKGIAFAVENLTPGVHALRVKPLTGATTLPVLLPQVEGKPIAIGDSTHILQFLEQVQPDPPLLPVDEALTREVWLLEDWLDESIGTATRFVYYDYRAGEGKQIDPSLASQVVIRVVRSQYGMNAARVQLAADRLSRALEILGERWQSQPYLVGDCLTAADIAAAALLSPLALIPHYRQTYPWLFDRITEIHCRCGEPLPPGLTVNS
ncbi:glutathione S-transferase family protein [Oscillatoria sp. FACHB-1407]|uniref:glutathione S-transferase family protein n=1 Tax=Oscillatoria sp. FACHB-1407 TaxID=2692847 RepID=UPI001688689C|nr:glutathione S-transferase family protein [Oscillatoria sp. FACHB-1407]MBD2460857.1 glutathione S-transferase family protein [Oscillatoria sp. FACHB-1407]